MKNICGNALPSESSSWTLHLCVLSNRPSPGSKRLRCVKYVEIAHVPRFQDPDDGFEMIDSQMISILDRSRRRKYLFYICPVPAALVRLVTNMYYSRPSSASLYHISLYMNSHPLFALCWQVLG